MKQLLENWRKFVNEITTLPQQHMAAFKEAISDSKFWEMDHYVDDVDFVTDNESSTPAAELLMDVLNNTATELGTELYFLVGVTDDEEYALGPSGIPYGYPNNWLLRASYQGPQKGKHVIWIQFRPLAEDFEMAKFNPGELVKVMSRTLNHELVHYYQLKKQAANKGLSDEEAWAELEMDPRQLPQDDKEQTYLGLHNEIDAYAHEATEQLLDNYSPTEALNIIRQLSPKNLEQHPQVSSVVKRYMSVFKEDPKNLDKFRKKLVQQVEKQSA